MKKGETAVYPESFIEKIGFDRIRSTVAGYTVGTIGEEKILNSCFSSDAEWVTNQALTVSEAQEIISEGGFPETLYFDLGECLSRLIIEGTFPEVQELFDLKRSVETGKAIASFFKRSREDKYSQLKKLTGNLKLYPMVSERVDQIVDRTGLIRDNASRELSAIRSSIASRKSQVSKKLLSFLKQAQSDGIAEAGATVSLRNGRGVIPVNAGDKRKLRGMIHDQSATGRTVFIEPEEIVELNNEITDLEYEERREIVRILIGFADFLRPYIDDLFPLFDFLGEIDSLMARAAFGNQLECSRPDIDDRRVINWRKARHPLLEMNFKKSGRKVVPLDIELDEEERILVISGPNAGGKSVCLKTVGLLQYMLQCGYPVPVAPGSTFGLFDKILIDIGDEQSIENDLSTYSSHLINMKNFLKMADDRSLVLVDEFGSGTEPAIGGAIAEAVLASLNEAKVYGIFTTHYTNLKHFAANSEGIVNGAMSYDNHLMMPLFEMVKGKPGSSFAFEIARKIGLPERVLEVASERAGKGNVNFDKHLREIARDKKYWEKKRMNIRKSEKKIEELLEHYEAEMSEIKQKRKEIITTAKDEASNLMSESNRLIENTIRTIKEAQADKEKTKAARKKIDEFKEKLAEESKEESRRSANETRQKKLEAEKEKKGGSPEGNDKPVGSEIEVGAYVKLSETNSYGEVTDIRGKMATITSGNLSMTIKSDRLERVGAREYKSSEKVRSARLDWEITATKNNFKAEIDIRGVRSDEALEMVRDLVDTAFMVGYRSVRILHGKGTGILRENVRNYLATHPVVAKFHDEHVDFGGSGITIVEIEG